MTFKLRDYTQSDASSVNQVALKAFEQFRDKYDNWSAMSESVGRMTQLSETAELIVAECKGEVVGAVGYVGPDVPKSHFPTEVPCIRMLVVNPSHRGHGIGRQLTQDCINRAIRDNASRIGLHTSPIMDIALPLYLRMGFVKEHDIEPIRGVPYAIYYKTLQGHMQETTT